MIGRTLAHYEIVGLLGKGGMGEVYRARDTRLGREVALKILPAGMADDPARRERFRREAQAVAALNHPHIVTLFSVEEDADVRFLTMELVRGRGLDEILTDRGLPLPEVLQIGAALADALASAHDSGILHRDLKPANLMITTEGRLKVLDFGLAKLVRDPVPRPEPATEVTALTGEGAVMGTIPYMSPEQLRGQEVDHRSDIFSLGILLYEMSTGRRPFVGESLADLVSAILKEAPPPLAQLRPGLPRALERTVARCLEKDPGRRPQSAGEVRDELSRLRGADQGQAGAAARAAAVLPSRGLVGRLGRGLAICALIAAPAFLALRGLREEAPSVTAPAEAPRQERSIAVLPFVNMSADPEQEYFSDGISEELLNLLTKIADLRVAARTSSFAFKGQSIGVPELAARLNVAYLLEGSVRKAGEQVRVTAQLIQAADGFHVWSETYDRRLDDIFAVQDEIAAEVVRQLRGTLLGEAPAARRTDPAAYALYLRSVQLARKNTERGYAESDSLLRRVLEVDPGYAPAWGALAANFGNKAASGLVPAEEGFAHAREANLRALESDPGYAPAYAGLAFVAMYGESDFAAAARHLQRAAALDPANGRVLGNSATLLNLLGRCDEAAALWEAIAIRDPVNVNALFNLGTSQINAGRLAEAIATYRTVLSLSPGNGVAHYQLGIALLLEGQAGGALAEFEQEPVEVFRMIGLPLANHALGRQAASDTALARLVARYEKEAAYNIAGVHAFRREADAAFAWLEKERRLGGTFAEIVADPLFANLHDDARWGAFLAGIGKAPDQVAEVAFTVAAPR